MPSAEALVELNAYEDGIATAQRQASIAAAERKAQQDKEAAAAAVAQSVLQGAPNPPPAIAKTNPKVASRAAVGPALRQRLAEEEALRAAIAAEIAAERVATSSISYTPGPSDEQVRTQETPLVPTSQVTDKPPKMTLAETASVADIDDDQCASRASTATATNLSTPEVAVPATSAAAIAEDQLPPADSAMRKTLNDLASRTPPPEADVALVAQVSVVTPAYVLAVAAVLLAIVIGLILKHYMWFD